VGSVIAAPNVHAFQFRSGDAAATSDSMQTEGVI
jgi:hypothetical protein